MKIWRIQKKRWLGLLLAAPAILNGAEWSGSIEIETRVFEHAPLYDKQDGAMGSAIALEGNLYEEWDDGNRAIELIPYARWDSIDEERSLLDLREASLLMVNGDWEVKLGVSKVFWGVAESQHLVDTINQTDFVSNLDGEDRLGQVMAHVIKVTRFGDFELFVLPGFRTRTFPGPEGRLRGPLYVDTNQALFESSAGRDHVDAAVRWFHIMGPFDIGVHYFRGTNRDPYFVPGVGESDELVLRPVYEQMDQVGFDLQYTGGGWLWKLEGLGRFSERQDYSAIVGGFEYTLYGIGGSDLDLGLLSEVHLDSRGAAAESPFNKDIFAGGRLTWNDEADTSLVFGAFYDWDTESTSGRLEFERRLKRGFKLEVEAQVFADVSPNDAFFPLRRDSFIQTSLSWHW